MGVLVSLILLWSTSAFKVKCSHPHRQMMDEDGLQQALKGVAGKWKIHNADWTWTDSSYADVSTEIIPLVNGVFDKIGKSGYSMYLLNTSKGQVCPTCGAYRNCSKPADDGGSICQNEFTLHSLYCFSQQRV